MATPLKIGGREEDGVVVLTLAGEVDVENAGKVRDAALKLTERGANRLVVDLAGVEYMDSAGLGMLIGLHKRLREANGELALAALQPQVRKLFDITGLVRVVKICGEVSEAITEVRG